MLPYLRLGPFLLQLPLLALLLGVWIGSTLAEKEATRLRFPSGIVNNMVFTRGLSGRQAAGSTFYSW